MNNRLLAPAPKTIAAAGFSIAAAVAMSISCASMPSAHAAEPTALRCLGPDLQNLVSAYLKVHDTDALEAFAKIDQIKDCVFSNIRGSNSTQGNRDSYVASLQSIDLFSDSSPEAIADLAIALQEDWNANEGAVYASLTFSNEAPHLTNNKAAFLVPALITLASFAFDRKKLPQLFLWTRHALPLIFLEASHTSSRSGAPSSSPLMGPLTNIAPSPAHIMKLGVRDDRTLAADLENEEQFQKLESLAIDAFAYGLAYDLTLAIARTQWVIRGLNTAATPGKWNPLVLVGSFVIGEAISYGGKSYLKYHTRKKAETELTEACLALQFAANLKLTNRLDYLTRNLNEKAKQLSIILSAEQAKRLGEYAEELNQLKADGNEAEYLAKIAELQIESQESSQATVIDTRYDGFLVRRLLRSPNKVIQQLPYQAYQMNLAAFTWASFQSWVHDLEIFNKRNLSMGERFDQRQKFLDRLDGEDFEELKAAALVGNWKKDPRFVLIQAASLYHNDGIPDSIRGLRQTELISLAFQMDFQLASSLLIQATQAQTTTATQTGAL